MHTQATGVELMIETDVSSRRVVNAPLTMF
jgi:hypothetical protein